MRKDDLNAQLELKIKRHCNNYNDTVIELVVDSAIESGLVDITIGPAGKTYKEGADELDGPYKLGITAREARTLGKFLIALADAGDILEEGLSLPNHTPPTTD